MSGLDIAAELSRVGFVVLPEVVPVELCANVIDAMRERAGLYQDDPTTWDLLPTAIDQVPMWGHQSQWEIRQLPVVYEAWSQALDTHRLWVTFDSCASHPPGGDRSAEGVHHDGARDPAVAVTDRA